MTLKTVFAALALTVLPGLAMAEGCSWGMGHQEANMSCAAGTTWDAESQSCVTAVSS